MGLEKRSRDIDILKGIGIILMISGHSGLLAKLNLRQYVSSFYMPLFFFVSGFFVNVEKYSFPSYLKKRFKRLMIPYGFWGVFHLLIYLLLCLGGIKLQGSSKQAIVGLLWNNNVDLPIAGALWFVSCLFFVEIFGFILLKYVPQMIHIIIVGVITLIGLYRSFFLPWSMDSGMVALSFWVGGYYFYKNCGEKLLKIFETKVVNYIFVLVLGMMHIWGSALNGHTNIRLCIYGVYPIMYIFVAFLGIIFWWFVAYRIQVIPLLGRAIRSIGENSMIYVCLNQLFISVILKLYRCYDLVFLIITTLLVIILCCFANWLCIKLKLHWMIGKEIS